MDKRTKEYKEAQAVKVIDRVYLDKEAYVIINGKRQLVKVLLGNLNLTFVDNWLVVDSGGITKINVSQISSILYK